TLSAMTLGTGISVAAFASSPKATPAVHATVRSVAEREPADEHGREAERRGRETGEDEREGKEIEREAAEAEREARHEDDAVEREAQDRDGLLEDAIDRSDDRRGRQGQDDGGRHERDNDHVGDQGRD